MGQPEQIEGNSKWYLMDSHGYMVVRVRPRMPLGETPSGAVSFDPSHAQLELQISDDGGVILQAAGKHELVTPSGESPRSAPLPVYSRVDIRLPNNLLHLDTDFSDLESAGEPLDIRAVGQPSTTPGAGSGEGNARIAGIRDAGIREAGIRDADGEAAGGDTA